MCGAWVLLSVFGVLSTLCHRLRFGRDVRMSLCARSHWRAHEAFWGAWERTFDWLPQRVESAHGRRSYDRCYARFDAPRPDPDCQYLGDVPPPH